MSADTGREQTPDVPLWLRDLCGAAWAARETFRLMGTPHRVLEEALAALPDEVHNATPSLAKRDPRPSATASKHAPAAPPSAEPNQP